MDSRKVRDPHEKSLAADWMTWCNTGTKDDADKHEKEALRRRVNKIKKWGGAKYHLGFLCNIRCERRLKTKFLSSPHWVFSIASHAFNDSVEFRNDWASFVRVPLDCRRPVRFPTNRPFGYVTSHKQSHSYIAVCFLFFFPWLFFMRGRVIKVISLQEKLPSKSCFRSEISHRIGMSTFH